MDMNRILLGIAIGAAASICLDSIAIAQDLQEVVVTGKGEVAVKPTGTTSSGVPIVNMSITYGVSYAGLDLASAAGAAELEKRVNDAAKDACAELSAKRPLVQFTTSDAECAKSAVDNAMVKVHELEAAAAEKK